MTRNKCSMLIKHNCFIHTNLSHTTLTQLFIELSLHIKLQFHKDIYILEMMGNMYYITIYTYTNYHTQHALIHSFKLHRGLIT